MNVTMSVSGVLEKEIRRNPQIKWTEIARRAMIEEATKMRKLEIMQKYMEKKEIADEDWKWMDSIDWHPVDEMNYKKSFIERIKKAQKEKAIKVGSVDKLFK
ncbi:MAG: hypothetical protein AB1467_05730 [Candidatus Diapherotrites archaeon]